MSIQEEHRRGLGSYAVRVLAALVVLLVILVAYSSRSRARHLPAPRVYRVTSTDFHYHGLPSTVRPGLFQVAFSNDGVPLPPRDGGDLLQPGQNAKTMVDDAKQKGADSEDDFLHFGEIADVDTGATMVGTFDLPAGTTRWPAGRRASRAEGRAGPRRPGAWSSPSRCDERGLKHDRHRPMTALSSVSTVVPAEGGSRTGRPDGSA
jgi:hypothetical protein